MCLHLGEMQNLEVKGLADSHALSGMLEASCCECQNFVSAICMAALDTLSNDLDYMLVASVFLCL